MTGHTDSAALAAPTPADLLQHVDWLQRLVRSLGTQVGSDAAQDTLLAALRARPAGEPAQVRAWLAAVVGGHAGKWVIVLTRDEVRPRTVIDPFCEHPEAIRLHGLR